MSKAGPWGICDRTGVRYPLKDLVWEYQNGRRTGLRVGRDVADPDHPQLRVGRRRLDDPKPLKDPRPDASPGRDLWSWNPAGNPGVVLEVVGGRVTVTVAGGG